MIYDRSYMRSESRRPSNVLKQIIWITVGVFILQVVFDRWFNNSQFLTGFLALSPIAIESGKVWTLLTYAFLHGNWMHLLFNVLAIYFLGKEVLPVIGAKRFVQLYLFAAAVGGAFWLVLAYLFGHAGGMVGASASAFGILFAFASIYPDKPVTFLLYFILPIRIRPRTLLYIAFFFSLGAMLLYELPGASGVAHSAHIGGMLAGWIFFRTKVGTVLFGSEGGVRSQSSGGLFERKKASRAKAANYTVNINNRDYLQKEVDRILDKINREGFGGLTEEEKEILDRARDILGKH